FIGEPFSGHTQTYISVGKFDSEEEAENCLKYIKTKFARLLLGVLKVTQDNPGPKWKYVPLQDFTNHSDIDWTKSISDIDN
ncbi:Eco57I restriction-modification methylase domain-containing protein, partial [Enterococcus faecalis]